MQLMTRIYLEIRMDLIDNWCTPVSFEGRRNEAKALEDQWRADQLAALGRRRSAAQGRAAKCFPPTSVPTAEEIEDEEKYIKRLFAEVKLPEDFEDNVKAYLEIQ
eukprot:CAMPEP_0197518766 /NCGR_PEP_ID=MMETSP1318-20131121/4007_1 /TAXON_ID=552666 /ORGANISM="Partenskyella glossopodia, Strain RCC365" /LENGTH=104 /DNA_ID=CAMNT_0043069365 /DNA_START=199 /DNA_END=513 /DNA_ORIENTATION=-